MIRSNTEFENWVPAYVVDSEKLEGKINIYCKIEDCINKDEELGR